MAIDKAYYLLDRLIDLGKTKTEKYYADYIKIHKLIYLMQCYCQYRYSINFTNCEIIAKDHGPYIPGKLDVLVADYGFDLIKSITIDNEYIPLIISPPVLRTKILETILRVFGTYNTAQIVKITKNTYAYQQSIINGYDTEISKELMKKTGEQIHMILEDSRFTQENISEEEKIIIMIELLKASGNQLESKHPTKRRIPQHYEK